MITYGTYTITEVQEGSQIWTTTVAPVTPNYTFTVSNLTGDSETSVKTGDIIMYSYYRYTVLSVSADGITVLAGNRVSIRGETGASAVTYSLIVSNLAIIKDKNGDISPTSITLTAKFQTGSSAMTNYAGRFKIETTTDNSTWTTQYTSSANESTKTWNVIDDIIAIRCSLYLKDGTTTLLDQQTIPIISDGLDGTNGNDAYSIVLTNDNHTFAGNTTSAIASQMECNVIAYKGTTQVAATIGTITGQPTGMTTSLLNNGMVNAAFRVSVTSSMVTKNGVLNVPITVDNKVFTKKFTYGLALDGEDGKDGGRWYSGTSITGTSTTATVFSGSGISSAVEGDMYLNTSTYNTYRCTLGGDASTAKWVYVNNIKGVHGDTGKGVSSIVNQYYLSTSNTTQTGGSWSTTVPPYVEDCYYWTKSHIVWTDNTETDTTAVLDNGLTDANANAIDARKVATNYLAVDNTGIMVADMQDGEQTPSTATGRNVFIDNDSVNIRDGQVVLSRFGDKEITLGEKGKARLELTSHSITGISDKGINNFEINGQYSEEPSTSHENGTFPNEASSTDYSHYNIVFKGGFTPNIDLNYFESVSIVLNYTLSKGSNTYSESYSFSFEESQIDNEGQYVAIIPPEVETSNTNYHISQRLEPITGDYFYFIVTDLNGNGDISITGDVSYSMTVITKKYQNSSFTFGSRVDSSVAPVGQNSCTFGEELMATTKNQIAIGRYNYDNLNDPYAFMVGNGFYGILRRNAFAVGWDGHIETGDIKASALEITENSQSTMDNYIDCQDVNNTSQFSVSKNGDILASATIGSPQIQLSKTSPANAGIDYINCQDINGNNKFSVSKEGNTEVAGALDVLGQMKAGGNPLFKFVTKTIPYVHIDKNGGKYPSVKVDEEGYTPVAISCITLSGVDGSSYSYCIVNSTNIDGDYLRFYVGNWNQSYGVSIKMDIKVLCIATSALGTS